MNYCKRCVLPDTRPGVLLDDSGICSACKCHESRNQIDWKKREEAFDKVVANAKIKNAGYDCLIPVSGGKDSTWQVVKCLEKGLNPLCVTWKTPARTSVGQKNLDNLVSLGVDHLDYQISPKTEKKFMLEALRRFGSTAIPMHMAIFNIPLKVALKFEIPLIIWGENSAFEYSGLGEESTGFKLNSEWLKNFGVTHGTTAKDWISGNLTLKELTPYFGPTPEELEKCGTLAVFLGYYFAWDVEKTKGVAQANGFQGSIDGCPKTGIYDFADIDDDFISIHHFLKWYKFGMTRSFDNLSLEIRNGRISRSEAIEKIKDLGEQIPEKDIKKLCNFLDISKKTFISICEKFRNHDIWFKDNKTWKIRNFLIPDWNWL